MPNGLLTSAALEGSGAGVSSALRSRVFVAVALQAFMTTVSASGKMVYLPGFRPPAYPERFFHALAGLAPLALIIVVLCAAVMLDLGRPPSAVRALAALSIALFVAGSLWAATEALNDEAYEPWLSGSFFLALIPSIAIWLAARRRSWWAALAALLSAVPTWVAVIFFSLATRGWIMKYLHGSW